MWFQWLLFWDIKPLSLFCRFLSILRVISEQLALFGGCFVNFTFQKKLLSRKTHNNSAAKLSRVKTTRNSLQVCQLFQYFNWIWFEKFLNWSNLLCDTWFCPFGSGNTQFKVKINFLFAILRMKKSVTFWQHCIRRRSRGEQKQKVKTWFLQS